MKTLKVAMLVAIALLFVISELAIAKGVHRQVDSRSMTPEEFVLKFPDSIFPENRTICEGNCVLLSKGKIVSRSLDEISTLESLGKGKAFASGFFQVKNPELLPKELKGFIETFKETRSNTECQEFQFFWQASQTRMLYEATLGNARLLDERNAYGIVAKKACGKYCLLQVKDLSEYSSVPDLSNLWHDSPIFLSLFSILGIALMVAIYRVRG